MLVYFGYTFCPDVCPTTLGVVGQALDKLTPDERKQVAPLFITIDPERDTPKVVGDYAANFAPDLVGLSGAPDAIQKVETRISCLCAEARRERRHLQHGPTARSSI